MEYHNIEAEQIILGSAIMDNKRLLKVLDILEAKHFYSPENAAVYEKMVEIVCKGGVADVAILAPYFKGYINVLLLKAVGYELEFREYAKEIREFYQKRQLLSLIEDSIKDLENKSFDFISSNISNELAGLSINSTGSKTQTSGDILDEMDNDKSASEFIVTGFSALDEKLNGGIYKQQLVILGARPSIGKTSFGQQVILQASGQEKKCLFVSLEVDKRNVMLKFLSQFSSIPNWKKFLSQSDQINLDIAKKELRKMRIAINDSSQMDVVKIGRIIKNQLDKEPLDLVVVDYIQIIRGNDTKNKNEATIIKDITSTLKSFAKQYNIGILALAQINRKAVESSKQEPTINDFKSSGGIEEDADVAMILHRDRNDEKKDSYFSKTGKLIIAKNRHGSTGEINISFDGETGRFKEIQGI